MSTDREALRLRDIIENIDRIEAHVSGYDLAAFVADAKTVDEVCRSYARIVLVLWR